VSLPSLGNSRVSKVVIHGGMARPSRPPGFDMTYRPTERMFGPPPWTWVPPILYMASAIAVGVIVIMAEADPDRSPLFRYLIEQGRQGWLTARTAAILLLTGGGASLIKTSMRGVRVWASGLDFRDVVSWSWPRVRRLRWAQVDCVVLDGKDRIALDLWDGSRVYLPEVAARDELATVLEKVAAARAIPVRGGKGLDEIPEPEAEDTPV
jgi:hypothetical protein